MGRSSRRGWGSCDDSSCRLRLMICFDCGAQSLELCPQHFSLRARTAYQNPEGGEWWPRLCADYDRRYPLAKVTHGKPIEDKERGYLHLQPRTRVALDELVYTRRSTFRPLPTAPDEEIA